MINNDIAKQEYIQIGLDKDINDFKKNDRG